MKVALLVEFNPRTRIVVDIPEGMDIDTYLADDENFSQVVEAARENMLKNGIADYLMGDNAYAEEDYECPFGTFEEDK